jgi:2-oxoisovalerate dehydrogenase E2 component (dihydrolipoyl transacylase)
VVTLYDFPLVDVGEGLTEAELVSWLVAPGDAVAVNQPLCEVETAKSVVELPSPYAGTVVELLVPVGETVPVGTGLLRLDLGAGAADSGAADVDPVVGDEPPLTLVGSGPKEQQSVRRRRVSPAAAATGGTAERPLAKPAARLLAREHGVDLAEVEPARADGVITSADVLAAGRHTGASVPATTSYDVAGETREPVKGVRKQMAQAMTTSAFTVPHVSIWTTVDATRTVELAARLQQRREFRELKVTPLLVVAKAVLLSLGRHPLLNSSFEGEEVVIKHGVNLGIAAATPRGLVVPNIKGADRLSLLDLATALGELVGTARAGRTQPADQAGGTFTITNVGPFGMEGGTPILNPGESGILCLGAIQRRPWVVGDELVARDVVTLSLSFDHRHIDGEAGSRFLGDVAAILEDPALAML